MTSENNPPVNLGQLLLRAFQWFDDGLLGQLHAGGWPPITRSHSMVFAHLDKEGTRPSEIARRIGVSRQAIHQVVRELEDMGLVAMEPDPTHRKAKLVVLTPLGRGSVTEALKAFANLEAELARRIGRRQVEVIRRALEADWGRPHTNPF